MLLGRMEGTGGWAGKFITITFHMRSCIKKRDDKLQVKVCEGCCPHSRWNNSFVFLRRPPSPELTH